jgi:hypothetical protein
MITGFNTDVKHKNRVYHVQTEDKGMANPKIESLVYVGGEILDSFRTEYAQMSRLNEEKIAKMMETQHRRVIRSIKMGGYDTAPSSELVSSDQSLDEVIVHYLKNSPEIPGIHVGLEALEGLLANSKGSLKLRVATSDETIAVDGAECHVRLVGLEVTPLHLASGFTDHEGYLALDVILPPSAPNQHRALKIQVFTEFGVFEKQWPVG